MGVNPSARTWLARGEEFAARVAAAAVLAALTVALQTWCLSDDAVSMSTRLSAALAVVDGGAS